MASTFSNLKIELIATGEQSGTWGITTNTNLGTALEEAIVGSADVSFSSADVTLTLTDTNATQTARNLRLNLTGTSGGARNLIVPAIEKPYIVYNGLADTVTVKNSTGTGVAVPTGKTMMVYNNGTDVVDVTTHASSLTLGTALPVASGGTGSTTLAGANIALINTGQTFTAAQTFRAASAVRSEAASTQDAVVLAGRAGGTSSYAVTLTPTTLSSSTTLTLPNVTDTVATIGTAQTFTAAQTFRAANAIRSEAASTQDAVVIAGRAGGTNSYAITLTPDTLTGNRTFTLPEPGENVTIGYLNIPQNSQSTAYTLVATDAGKQIFHPSADTTARTYTIPANSSVAYPIGTAITFINQNGAGVITIAITSDTMRLAGAGTTGSRTLAANGIATCVKVTSTEWIISGTGLT